MKKRIVIILFASLLLLCACVPTPESSIIVGKDQTAMIEQAKEPIAAELQNLTIRERLHVPDRLTYSYHKGKLTIDADAEVVVPDAELPIVRVFPSDFEQAVVTDLWNVLIGDMPMTAIIYERTKAEIAESIEWLMTVIDNGDIAKHGFASEEEAEQALKALQKQYKEAPDIAMGDPVDSTLLKGMALDDNGRELASHTYIYAESKETGYRFRVSNNWNNKEVIVRKSYDEFGREVGISTRTVERSASLIFIKNNEPQASCYIWGNELRFDDPRPEKMCGTVTITPQQAKTFADAFLDAAKLSDTYHAQRIFLIFDNESTESAYRVVCTRTVNGVPALITGNTHESGYASEDEEEYVESWDYEGLWIDVNDGGVYCIQLHAPLAIGDVVTEQTNLLPFSEIQKIMKKMLPVMYETEAKNFNGEDMELTYEKHINRVELGLWRVREQNNIERGLLIPVWAFYANTAEHDKETDYTYETYLPILLINAVDGSIIDPQKGY